MLGRSSEPLASRYDVIGLDLDGVVYIGADAIPHAVPSLESAASVGGRLTYVTNNASRAPHEIAEHLRSIGLSVSDEDVVTSSQAAAALLRERLSPGERVYVIGGDGLVEAVRAAGLEPVVEGSNDVAAVVQGYGPDVPWKRIVLAARLVKEGCFWVATNTDMTFPLPGGIGPGNGTLVELVSKFSAREPIVAGKPYRPLFDEVITRFSPSSPLFVGDRLDTDIRGANSAGWPSLLVRTGVTSFQELLSAAPLDRPTYLSADLRGLLTGHESPQLFDGAWHLGGWVSRVDDDVCLRVEGVGEVDDWWRCVVSAAWAFIDENQSYPQTDIANVDQLVPPG